MAFELKGKVIEVLPLTKGTSANNKEWQKQIFAIEEIEGNYPKKVAFQGFGDKCNLVSNLKVNQVITVHFNVESNKFKDNYFTNLSVWKIDFEGVTNGSNEPVVQAQSTVVEDNQELPF
jgi:hypothetical protein